jgi:hypothetical protein
MAEFVDREHYIPLRRKELIDLVCRCSESAPEEQCQLRTISRLLASIFHFEFLRTIEDLADDYAPFDPDRETASLRQSTPAERFALLDKLFTNFNAMLERGNYEPLTENQLQKALAGRSRWGLTMDVDFGIFDRLSVYVRGNTTGKRSFRNWRRFWKAEEIEIPIFRRLVVMLKLREEAKGRIGPEVNSNGVYVKIFKDIPQEDIEMLLPGAKLKMNNIDKTKVTFPMLTFIILAFWNVIFVPMLKFIGLAFIKGPVGAGAVSLYGIAAASGTYGYRSYASYNYTRNQYSLQLTRSLYYQNLDNNSGVFYMILNEAEQQEWREAMLGYYCLHKDSPPQGCTAAELDDGVEAFLEKHAGLKVDFEIGDAMKKLERLRLVHKDDAERFRAVPLSEAIERLREAWDGQFKEALRAASVVGRQE